MKFLTLYLLSLSSFSHTQIGLSVTKIIDCGAGVVDARPLHELWLKKLKCKVVLSLLRKLEILRRAPSGFDLLIRPLDGGLFKIGAVVVVLSESLSIIFSDDVAQVQAFDRFMEQLMTRK